MSSPAKAFPEEEPQPNPPPNLVPEVTLVSAKMSSNETLEDILRIEEPVASQTQSHHEENHSQPAPEQTPNAKSVTEETTDTEQTTYPEPFTSELAPPSATVITDPTLHEPSILHIFYDA